MDQPQKVTNFLVDEDQTLSDFINDMQGVIVVFFPQINSISSTLELKSLRNEYHTITNLGWKMIAISTDSKVMQDRFAEEHNLNFPIISDPVGYLAEEFGCLGITVDNPFLIRRAKRRTYLIDHQLRLVAEFSNIQPRNHANRIRILIKESIIVDQNNTSRVMSDSQPS